ncbi:major facilitator transporter [Caballeronia turbans]|nr:major facilitator transporter [Caballeronia turbans]
MAALLATAMMVLLANMSIEPIITVYIGGLGVTADHVARIAGVVMACSALGSMLTAARLGALADRIGSWNVIVGCLVLTGIAMIPQAFVHQWWQLAALRVLMGMTLAGLLPSISKLARSAVDENRSGQLLGYLQSAQFSGQVTGPLIGGQIGVWFGLHSVFFATGSLLIICVGLAYLGAHPLNRAARFEFGLKNSNSSSGLIPRFRPIPPVLSMAGSLALHTVAASLRAGAERIGPTLCDGFARRPLSPPIDPSDLINMH